MMETSKDPSGLGGMPSGWPSPPSLLAFSSLLFLVQFTSHERPEQPAASMEDGPHPHTPQRSFWGMDPWLQTVRSFPPGLSLANELKTKRKKKCPQFRKTRQQSQASQGHCFVGFFLRKKIKSHCFSLSKAIVSMCPFLFSRDKPQKISLLLMGERGPDPEGEGGSGKSKGCWCLRCWARL